MVAGDTGDREDAGAPELLTDAAGGLATIAGTQLAAELGGLLSDVGSAFLTGEFADYLAASMRSACGTGLARHIPGARARLRRGEGHLSIGAGGLGPVFEDLIDLAGL